MLQRFTPCSFSLPFYLGIFFFLLTSSLLAQNGFQNGIGMQSFERASSIKILPGGGYVICGEAENTASNERDMLLLTTDANGNLQWTHTYGGPERETANDVLRMNDGTFLFTAEKYQPNKVEGENLTLVHTDQHGNLTWKKIFDEGGIETEGFALQPTNDNNYIIAGMAKNSSLISDAFFTMSAEEQSVYLLKVSGNGNKVWSRRFNPGINHVSTTATSVATATDGSYIVIGNIAYVGKTDKKIERPANKETINTQDVRGILLLKVKPNGSLQWAREFDANNISMGYQVIEKKEGGFLLAGNTSISKTDFDIFIISTDAGGNIQWAKTFGGTKFESVSDVIQTTDGGFVCTGTTESFGAGMSDILLFKTDNTGNIQWTKTYGGKNEEYPSRLALAADGIVITGSVASFNSQSFDVLLLKTDLNGNSNCLGVSQKMNSKTFAPVSKQIQKASMVKVEQGVTPPNMKKPDVNNIVDNKQEKVRLNKLCN